MHARVDMDEFKSVPLPLIRWKAHIRNFAYEDVENMGASLRVHGQVHPIVVKPPDEHGVYEGVCGRLRYEGAKQAMIPEVLVRVHNFKDDEEVLEWQLAENLHRKELSAIERAEAYAKLAELRKKHHPEEPVVKGIALAVEALTGTKPAEKTVRKYLQISRKIGEKAKKISPRGELKKVGIKHLEQISRVPDEDVQAQLLEQTALKDWSVQKVKQEVDKALGLRPTPPEPIDTGIIIKCPKCGEIYTLIHVDKGKHRLQKVKVARRK